MPKSAKLSSAALLLVVVIVSLALFNRHDSGSRYQSTDDAYIRADSTIVGARVNGQIKRVLARENQKVKAGDLLFAIDEREFVLQVNNAEALLANAQASRAGIEEQIKQQHNIIAQARAALQANKAALELSRLEYHRYRDLVSDGSGSKQAYQQAAADYKIAQATLARSQAQYESEIQRTRILKTELDKAQALTGQAQAALETARLNLSYCQELAPIDGIISQQSARLGAYVSTGSPVLAIVPLQDSYIEAYFRETQLLKIRPEQPVVIKADALPGETLPGKVASLGPASNASFSPLAPHSTSSNFTKVVQRLPVRISFGPGNREALRAGMSVIVEVDTGE
jgi:membrane fusion protein (multidrug efflux system)